MSRRKTLFWGALLLLVLGLTPQVGLSQSPHSALTDLLEAQILARKGEWALAIKSFQELVKKYPQDLDLRADFAQTLLSAGELKKAKQQLDFILTASPNNVRGHTLKAWLHWRTHELEKEYQERLWLVEALPEDYDNLSRLAAVAQDLSRTDKVIDLIIGRFKDHPQEPDAARAALAAALVTGRPDRLVELRPMMLQVFGSDEKILLEAARTAKQQGLQTSALKAIEAYPFKPSDAAFMAKLAEELSPDRAAMARMAKVKEAYEQTHPRDPGLGFQLADLYIQINQATQAYEVLMELAPEHQDSDQLWRKLLEVSNWTENPRDRQAALILRLKHYPEDREARRLLAESLLAEGPEKAKENMSRLRQYYQKTGDPVFLESFLKLAQGYSISKGDVVFLNKILGRTRDVGLLGKIGEVFLAREMTAEAIVAYEKIRQLRPADPLVLEKLVECYGWLDKTEKRFTALVSLFQMKPTDKVRLQLAEAAYVQKKFDLAYEHYLFLEQKNKLNPDRQLDLADLALKRKNLGLARSIWSSVLKKKGVSAEVLHRAGQLALAGNDLPAADALTGKAIAKDPKRYEVIKTWAIIHMALGKTEQAIMDIKRYLSHEERDFEAHFLLGEYLNHQGLEEAAMMEYAQAEKWILEFKKGMKK